MFQVASHPTSFDAFAPLASPPALSADSPLSPASALVQLPRKLARPQFTPVPREPLARANPELKDVPLEYVRAGLQAQAPQMLAASAALQPHLPAVPRAALPASLALAAGPATPTHVLALTHASGKAAPGAPVPLLPTHHLVLLASCAQAPPLPAARAGSAPVVLLAVPAPDVFAPLHAFLYTRAAPALLGALLGLALPPNALAGPSSGGAQQLAGTLAHALVRAAGGDAARLMAAARRVNGCWRNACALGAFDLELWDALDLAWEAVLGALNAAVRK